MWSLKFKVLNKDSIYTLLTTKFRVNDFFYPLDNYRKNKKIFILGMHFLEGEEKEVSGFIKTLRKDKKLKKCDGERNKWITLIAEEESFYELLFSAEFYHPSPVFISKGYEQWHIASWDRIKLEKIIKEIERWKGKLDEFKLLSLQKTDLREIYFPKIAPKLPEMQKKAFELALKKRYYEWPRASHLKDLAKESGVSIATFQENLRKAEAKLMPFFAS